MPRATEQETLASLQRTELRWAEQERADDRARDAEILTQINRAIEMQTGDNDSPSDAKVMAALRAAKSAQEADIKEG